MKVEFNGNGFSADMNETPKTSDSISAINALDSLKGKGCLLFSIAALLFSLLSLPLGLFMNISADILERVSESSDPHYITVLCVISFVIIAISMMCGILGIVLFAKSKKCTSDTVGVMIAILSLVLCVISLVLNIIGLTVW